MFFRWRAPRFSPTLCRSCGSKPSRLHWRNRTAYIPNSTSGFFLARTFILGLGVGAAGFILFGSFGVAGAPVVSDVEARAFEDQAGTGAKLSLDLAFAPWLSQATLLGTSGQGRVFHGLKKLEVLLALEAEVIVSGHLERCIPIANPLGHGKCVLWSTRLTAPGETALFRSLFPFMRSGLFPLLPLILALVTTACQTDPRLSTQTEYLGGVGRVSSPNSQVDNVSYWDGDGFSGKPSVVIRLGEQRAYFFKGDQLVGVSSISSGREGFDTKSGNFKIVQKNKDHRSNLYGDYVDQSGKVLVKDIDIKKDPMPPGARFDGAKMPYFMRIVGGIGMHAGFLPGYPDSHGCIRMPEHMAKIFFDNVSVGTPVNITY